MLPQKCGVYLFRNSQGEIIYVGKAINIQKRVKSHFTHRDLSPFRKDMLEETKVVNYLLTADEHEALMLEEELIKAYKPQYNLRLKDDKSYPYIRVSIQGAFPSITFSRKKMGKEGYYFGPFTNAKKVREGIKILRTLFLLRGCEIPESRFPLQRPCIEYNLRLCSAPCIGRISQEAYHKNLEKALDFLNGNYDSVTKWLEEEMWKAANVLDFETAAFYRNHLKAAKEIATRYRLVLPQAEDVDFLEATCGDTLSVVAVVRVRRGKLVGSESFIVESKIKERVTLLKSFIEDFYLPYFSLPKRVCVHLDEVTSLNYLQADLGLGTVLGPPSSISEKELLNFALENAQKNLEIEMEKMRKREMCSEKVLEKLQNTVGLKSIPHLIEGIDISNFQGDEAVGVIVSFRQGVPYKKRYRKFIIRQADYPNDYGMLKEVVQRHFRKLQESALPLPDLLLVDGGIGQLHVAVNTLQELGVSVPVISLAKEWEEIYFPGNDTPLRLSSQSEVLQLLQRIRNEAHRFAITFHRMRRNKKLFSSFLSQVEGIGPVRTKKLLAHYDSLWDIIQVSPEEISKNLRIPLTFVMDLQKRLKETYADEFQRNSQK